MTKAFCLAYGNGTSPAADAATAAQFPLIITAQSAGQEYMAWRDQVKAISPTALILAYHQTAFQQAGDGPGYVTMAVQAAAAQLAQTMVPPDTGHMYNYLDASYKAAYLEAIAAVMASWPYDGVFLDNFTVWLGSTVGQIGTHTCDPVIRSQMFTALQDIILTLRRWYPNKIIITNNAGARYFGSNGGMTENDVTRMAELAPFNGQAYPNMNLFYLNPVPNDDMPAISIVAAQALSFGAYFGYGNAAALQTQSLLVT